MIYNLPLLLGLYAIIGGLNCAIPLPPTLSPTTTWRLAAPLLIPVVAVLCGWMWIDDDVMRVSVIILSLLANTVHGCLTFAMRRRQQGFLLSPSGSSSSSSGLRLVGLSSVGVFLLTQGLGVVYSRVMFHHESWWWALQPLGSVLYVSCILFALVLSILSVGRNERSSSPSSCGQKYQQKQPVAFAALLIVLLPVVVSGKLMLMRWEGGTRASSWYFLWRTLGPVYSSCLIQIIWRNGVVTTMTTTTSRQQQRRQRSWSRIRSAILVAAVVGFSPWILARGAGFRTAYLLPFIACVDIVESFVVLSS